MSVFFISDFGLLVQFIQALATLLFLRLVDENERKNMPLPKLFIFCSAIFLLTWLGIKTYETMKILPFLFLAFLFLVKFLPDIKGWISRRNNLVLAGLVLGLFILVVPFTSSFKAIDRTQEVKNMFLPNYHWDSLWRSVFQNTKNAWESEPDIAFFSLKSCLPFSLARTLGLLLCWTVLLTVILLILRRSQILKELDQKKQALWRFTGLWLLADIAALGAVRESDPRHLMVPLVPLTIFFTASFFFISKTLGARARKGFLALCLAGWAFSFGTNLNHQIYFRKFLGGFQIGQQKYLDFIYEDYHGKKPTDYEDLIEFMLVPQQLNIWHIPFIVDENYVHYFEEWTRYDYLLPIQRKHGKAYVVTADPARVKKDLYLEKIGEFTDTNKSLFTDLILRFKKKKGRLFGVYRFNPERG